MDDEKLRQYVEGIFERYDLDRSNTLTLNELTVFFNDLLVSRGAQPNMSMQQVRSSLRAMDTNLNGEISKAELFNALKRMNSHSAVNQQNTIIPPTVTRTTNTIQYPSLSALSPSATNLNPINQQLYAKYPTVASIPAATHTPQLTLQQQIVPPIATSPVYQFQTFAPVPYVATEIRPRNNVVYQPEFIQPIATSAQMMMPAQTYMMAPPMTMMAPMMGPPPFGMMDPWGMGPYGGMGMGPYGGMGMGMGPYGGMGPFGMGMSPMGMGMRISPFSGFLGRLFGF